MTGNEILDPPGSETEGWDEVKITFADGSSTLVWVNQDLVISEEVAEICDREGWDTKDVTGTRIVG